MDKILFPISLTSSVLLVYLVSASLNFPYGWIFSLFILINGMLLWMVYKVLRDGEPSTKKFDDYFYEDWDYKRSGR